MILYSRKREQVPDLASLIWFKFGAISALLQEVINIYPYIDPPSLSVIIFGQFLLKVKSNIYDL